MKRVLRMLLSLSLLLMTPYSAILAEEDEGDKTTETSKEESGSEDYSNNEYWTNLCTGT